MHFDEEKQIQQLVSMYCRGFEEILRVIVEKEAKGQWAQYQRDLLIQINVILRELDTEAEKWIEGALGQVYSQAAADTAAFLMGLGKAVTARPEFSQVHQKALDVLAQNLADNLRDATQFVGRRVNDVFRQVGLEATAGKFASGATVRGMKQEVIKRLLDQGQTAFKDRLGRKWRLDTYAEMCARTVTREAASVATINTCREAGLDLVRITTHYPTCELCAPLQGKVFSISGKDSRYPKLTDERRPPIHPHCRHVLTPYVRELDDKAEETERFSNQPLNVDPRSEAEKQVYKEIRDKVTIETNRRRAREVLLNPDLPIVEKIKAAEKLKKTYEKTGTRPRGRDAKLLGQYKDFLANLKIGRIKDINGKTGVITVEGNTLPTKAFPHATIDLEHKKLKIKVRRRLYDVKGNAKLDIDLTDHGHPKAHPLVPHAHDWKEGGRSKEGRKLTDEEREMIKDIWGGDK